MQRNKSKFYASSIVDARKIVKAIKAAAAISNRAQKRRKVEIWIDWIGTAKTGSSGRGNDWEAERGIEVTDIGVRGRGFTSKPAGATRGRPFRATKYTSFEIEVIDADVGRSRAAMEARLDRYRSLGLSV